MREVERLVEVADCDCGYVNLHQLRFPFGRRPLGEGHFETCLDLPCPFDTLLERET